MKVYAVEQKYFDNGIVQANTHLIEAESIPPSRYEERPTYDFYIDYFTDPVKAEQHRQEALKA